MVTLTMKSAIGCHYNLWQGCTGCSVFVRTVCAHLTSGISLNVYTEFTRSQQELLTPIGNATRICVYFFKILQPSTGHKPK